MEYLSVEFDSVFYDQDLKDYLVDEVIFNFDGNTYLHVGYRKPFNDIYVNVTASTVTSSNAWEYFNGTNWVTLDAVDETKNFNQGGYIFFDRPNDWAKTDVSGKSLFYIRILKANLETATFSGINTILANDNDLKEVYRKIEVFRESNDTSFIATHQTTKKDIVQYIRNSRHAKYSDAGIQDIYVWDLLKRSQLRRAATYWALSIIFFNVSDSVDGKFYQLAKDYKAMAMKAVDVYLLDIDKDDDGKSSKNDLDKIQYTKIRNL